MSSATPLRSIVSPVRHNVDNYMSHEQYIVYRWLALARRQHRARRAFSFVFSMYSVEETAALIVLGIVTLVFSVIISDHHRRPHDPIHQQMRKQAQ